MAFGNLGRRENQKEGTSTNIKRVPLEGGERKGK